MTTYAFTSVNRAYLSKARVLVQSLKEHNPAIKFCLLLAEPGHVKIPPQIDDFDEVTYIGELGVHNLKSWIFEHSVVELCTAVKGFFLEKLLERPDCENVLYFDPDIVVLTPLDKLIAEFNGASVLLTPHITKPESDFRTIKDNEINALRHGLYNLGFLGVKNDNVGQTFARWWRERLKNFCYADIPNGIFTDQKWIDLAPIFFPNILVLKEPGYNVATWNLTSRKVEGSIKTNLTVNGEPLRFYHFSGIDSGAQLKMLERYGADMPALFEFRQWYLTRCEELAPVESVEPGWFYDVFSNGEKITADQRKTYRDRPDLKKAFVDPFSAEDAKTSYLHWYRIHGGKKDESSKATDCSCDIDKVQAEKVRLETELDQIYRSKTWQLATGIRKIQSLLR